MIFFRTLALVGNGNFVASGIEIFTSRLETIKYLVALK